MIFIADSGSSKCDGVFIDSSGKEIKRMSSMGFNPYFHSSDFIAKELSKLPEIDRYGDQVTHVYFYGAGCSSPALKAIVADGLTEPFPNAVISVNHDLAASAYATYNGQPHISCILGTGSNAVYFDGKNIGQEVPSLAYILGDEGSGSYIGKKVLSSFFYKKMPSAASEDFEKTYNLTKDDVLKRIYTQPHANIFLASFTPFAKKHIDHPFFWEIVFTGFLSFLEIHVTKYEKAYELPVSFVGSVAYHFEDILKNALSHLNLRAGEIIQKPMDGLIKYHLNTF